MIGNYALLTLVLVALAWIIKRQEDAMATVEQFEQVLAKIDAATSQIAVVLRTIKDLLTKGGLTDDQEATVLAHLGTTADALDAIAKDPTNPVPNPPVEPPVIEG